MRKLRSRLARVEERRNIRKAILYLLLTVGFFIFLITFGLPSLVKMASFLTEIRKSNQPVEKNDTTPPAPPKIYTSSEKTNKLQVEIKGLSEPGVKIQLFLNDSEENLIVNKDGEFNYSFSLRDGENFVSAKAKDSAGNESLSSSELVITFDNEKPFLEIISPENKEFYGSRQRLVVIEGNTEEDARVTINDRQVVVEKDGRFTFATSLQDGENNFIVKSVDLAENTNEITLVLSFSP